MKINKPILFLPAAGKGQRFRDAGIQTPKQLLTVNDLTLIQRSINSIKNLDKFHVVCVSGNDRIIDHVSAILNESGVDFTTVKLNFQTNSVIETLSLALKEIDISDDLDVCVHTLDIELPIPIEINLGKNTTVTFTASSKNYSYVCLNEFGFIDAIKEKEVISNNANVGIYNFSSGYLFKKYLSVVENKKNDKEQHISNIIHEMLLDDFKFSAQHCDHVYIFGTPEELHFYKNHIAANSKTNRIIMFSDHSGYETKKYFANFFSSIGYDVLDVGCNSIDMCSYSDYASLAIDALKNLKYKYIFGFCRSGQGVNIAINKINQELISSLIYDVDSFKTAIEHNNARVFCFPERVWINNDLEKIDEIINTSVFEGGRHSERLFNAIYGAPEKSHTFSKKNLRDFKGGWIVGDFSPALFKSDIEIGVKYFEFDTPPDAHYHAIGDEYTIILNGSAKHEGKMHFEGDIILIKNYERNSTYIYAGTKILTIKTKSNIGDKYYD